MKTYLNLLDEVLREGVHTPNRTGIAALETVGKSVTFKNIGEHFPAVTTKKLFYKGVVSELRWMLSGDPYITRMREDGVKIWEPWVDEAGYAGRGTYGCQWRKFGAGEGGYDQLNAVLEEMRENPFGRRHLVSAWNPAAVAIDTECKVGLPPCHTHFQFVIRPDDDGKPSTLDCVVYMRSCDIFLGLPFDVASYATLQHIFAEKLDLYPDNLTFQFGSLHLYENHIEQAKEQLGREPKSPPELFVYLPDEDTPFEDITEDMFKLVGYESHPAIKGDIAV